MNAVRKKRGQFASRAHSFKENLLDALKNSPVGHVKSRPEKNHIVLAKKTSSTDNLTGHLGTAKTTDCLVKEVQFALKYFQDVVSKQTYEMLPGCATVVLETVLAIQAFAGNVESPMSPEVETALGVAFKAVSVLTSWADFVIVEGTMDHEEDYGGTIIEPVRRAVIVLVNILASRIGSQALGRGNSLPDITSDSDPLLSENDLNAGDSGATLSLSHSSDSILDLNPEIQPILFPKKSSFPSRFDVAPPLPPKHIKPHLNKSFKDLIAHSYSLRHMEWLNSHTEAMEHSGAFLPSFGVHRPVTSAIRRTVPTVPSHHHQMNQSLPEPRGLDTTLDQSFEHSADNTNSQSPASISKESLTNTSLDEPDFTATPKRLNSLGPFSRSWSSRDRSNTSSPSFETQSLSSHLSDPQDRGDQPPAIPRKSRDSLTCKSTRTSIKSHGSDSTSNCSSTTPSRPFPSRKLSQYDNIPDSESYSIRQMYDLTRLDNEMANLQRQHIHNPQWFHPQLQMSESFPFASPHPRSRPVRTRGGAGQDDTPPPLPPKKRNIMSYMEMFGKSIIPSGEDLLQGIFHPHDLLHTVWQQNFHEYSEYAPSSLLNFPFIEQPKSPDNANLHSQKLHPYINLQISTNPDTPPALPPKRSSRSRPGSFRSSGSSGAEAERQIPIIREDIRGSNRFSQLSSNSSASSGGSSSSDVPRLAEITKLPRLSVSIPIHHVEEDCRTKSSPDKEDLELSYDPGLLDEVDVNQHLVYGLPAGDVPNNNNKAASGTVNSSASGELRAGTVDALVILATQTIKNDFLYQEAFLTTYRTFIKSEALTEKLVYRFRKFRKKDGKKTVGSQKISRAAFSLLVRVVDGLSDCDFQNKPLLERLTRFITRLIECGDLGLARALRSQFILKYEERRTRLLPEFDLASLNSVNRRANLLNFKSIDVAEQMTLLDSHLFLRIDSAELLLWVQEQNEEKSVNLTKFTEHFNNMSYWTRTLILQQPDGKERERYVMKFIKIMKWLRKMNNFNSYLAILSALDSAPIRRLEWQKNITDGLKEYCSLIDSSSSFRAYRLALGESCPPCIPYIGLVLQDLTFVQIGNPDLLEGKINFAKRWQQFNILDNLRRFKKEQYNIGRQEEIILFFGEFDDYLTEDEMWNLSETIKPRGQTNKGVK